MKLLEKTSSLIKIQTNYINLTDNELIEENPIIDQNTDINHIHEHLLICSCTDKINTETPNNKETNDKIVSITI